MRTCSYSIARRTIYSSGSHIQMECAYTPPAPFPAAAGNGTVASMAMPRFKVTLDDKLLAALTASSEKLWPGQGRRGVSRLTRDAIRRYRRPSDGNTRRRTK